MIYWRYGESEVLELAKVPLGTAIRKRYLLDD
jgi:hypothetical protein